MSGPLQSHERGVLIRVWVVPGARNPGVAGLHGESLKIRVSAPAEKGEANRAVSRLLSEILGVDVELLRGMTSREKVFLANGIDSETARSKLEA